MARSRYCDVSSVIVGQVIERVSNGARTVQIGVPITTRAGQSGAAMTSLGLSDSTRLSVGNTIASHESAQRALSEKFAALDDRETAAQAVIVANRGAAARDPEAKRNVMLARTRLARIRAERAALAEESTLLSHEIRRLRLRVSRTKG